ncbi:MAG TPA: hypothetical protein VN832_05415 [Stellaceae bacterium]|nr:hypothetical protein [Stellaceae bacterium]
MLGLSLGKLLILILLIGIVWYGFKYVQRVEEIRQRLRRQTGGQRRDDSQDGSRAAEDLVKCPRCGAYVAVKSRASCGRADCPWGG